MREAPQEDRPGVRAAWPDLELAFGCGRAGTWHCLVVGTGEIVRFDSSPGHAGPTRPDVPASDVILLDPVGARAQHRWMVEFVECQDDVDARRRLRDGLHGSTPFRMFKRAVRAEPALHERWAAFRRERLRAFVRAWFDLRGLRLEAFERPASPPRRKPAAGDDPSPPDRARLFDLVDELEEADLAALTAVAAHLREMRLLHLQDAGREPKPDGGPAGQT